MTHGVHSGVLVLATLILLAACGDEEQETGGEVSEIDVEELSREEAQAEEATAVVRDLLVSESPVIYDPPPDLALPAPGAAVRPGPQAQIRLGIDTPAVAGTVRAYRPPPVGPQTAPDTTRPGRVERRPPGQPPDTTEAAIGH